MKVYQIKNPTLYLALMRALSKSFLLSTILTSALLIVLFGLWTYKGVLEAGLHADFSRDLSALSQLWIHRIVWLGPYLRIGFPTSPIYYYFLFPGVVISNGSAYSLVVSQTFLSTMVLGILAWFNRNKPLAQTSLLLLTIGLSPWWITATTHPWNGHQYVVWVMLALVLLWFKKHVFASSLALGIGIAIHPAAIFALPILIYECIREKNKMVNTFFIIMGLVLPWTPILIFEFITKGFLIRQWLQHHTTVGSFFFSLESFRQLSSLAKLSPIVAACAWVFTALIASKRARWWWLLASTPLIFLFFSQGLHDYYLFGIMCTMIFIVVMSWSKTIISQIALVIVFIVPYTRFHFSSPPVPAGRSVSKIESVVTTLATNGSLNKGQTYALVSVLDETNPAPQADEYQFFLRTKGFIVKEIHEFSHADKLLVFSESPLIDARTFDDWHTQQFGHRQLESIQTVNGITISQFNRK